MAGRWVSTWVTWLRGFRGPPEARWVTRSISKWEQI
jgi:hypothetical protein